MNCLKRLSFAIAVCLAAFVPLWSQTTPAAQVVYVATGDSQVYSVSTDGSATVTNLIPSDDVNSSAHFTSLTVGPDNVTTDNTTANNHFFLYACDTASSTIVRLRLSVDSPGAVSDAVAAVYNGDGLLTTPICGRVSSNGDLYVSSGVPGAGVYIISGVSTASSGSFSSPDSVFDDSAGENFTGGGIAQKNNGDMLVVDNHDGTILRARFLGANEPPAVTSNPPFSSTLSGYVGSLSSPSAIARVSAGDFFVADQGTGSVLKFNPAELSKPTTCRANLPNGNVTLSSVAASEDNFVYVGIASTSPNKRLVRILDGTASKCGSITSIPLSGISARSVAAVAVPPVEESPLAASPSPSTDPSTNITSATFNFGSSIVKSLTTGCAPTVTQRQVPIPYLNALLSGASPAPESVGTWDNGGVAIPYNGEGGFGTLYTVTVSGECSPADVYNNFIIASSNDNTYYQNPRIIKCDGSIAGGDLDCRVLDASGNWPIGGLLPNDPTIGGKVPGFSRFFLANGTLSESVGTFCGFSSPLTTTADPTTAPIFNSGQNLSVKFKLGATPSCSNGDFITDARASLSIARIADAHDNPVFEPIAINSSGSSTPVPPTFSYNPNSQQYQFSLSLKGYAKGIYSLTVTFLTSNAPYVTTYFQVQ